MFNAVLDQITHPPGYTAVMLRRQTAWYMAKNPYFFFPLVEPELDGESYRSYVENIFEGNVWADDMIATAISKMFNVSITIISPRLPEALHLFHGDREPDILLIGNGGTMGTERENTHFSASKSKLANYKKPGSSMKDDSMRIIRKMNYDYGFKTARERLIEGEKRHAVERLVSLNKGIAALEEEMKEMNKQLQDLKRRRKGIETELVELGINQQQLKQLTDEREKERQEKEREEKDRIEREKVEVERKERAQEEQRQREEEERQRKERERLEQAQEEQRQREERERVERVQEEQRHREQEIEVVEAEEVVQTTSRAARIQRGLDRVLPAQFHHFVTGQGETQEGESQLVTVEVDTEKIATLSIPSPPPPQQQAHPQVAQQVVPSQAMSLAATGGIKGRFGHLFYKGDDERFYCLSCKKNYRFRQDINKHVKTCGQEVPKYICQVCGASLSSKNALKEHSDRHSEAKEVRCKYCGEKFYNKSKRSIHYLKCSAKKEYEEQLRLEREGADKETK